MFGKKKKLSKEDEKKMQEAMKKQMAKMMKEREAINQEMQKVAKPFIDRQRKIIEEEIPNCKDCKKVGNYYLEICPKHLTEIREVSEKLSEIELGFKLRMTLEHKKQGHSCSSCSHPCH